MEEEKNQEELIKNKQANLYVYMSNYRTFQGNFHEKVLKNILDAKIPFDSVAFKDASGTSTPQTVYETVKRARKMLPQGTHIRL